MTTTNLIKMGVGLLVLLALVSVTTAVASFETRCVTEEGGVFASPDICCAASCGTCGGTGCTSRPGSTANCCTGAVGSNGVACEDNGLEDAPCSFSASPPSPTPVPAPTPTPAGEECLKEQCETGEFGIFQAPFYCCPFGCGRCGGTGCGLLPGKYHCFFLCPCLLESLCPAAASAASASDLSHSHSLVLSLCVSVSVSVSVSLSVFVSLSRSLQAVQRNAAHPKSQRCATTTMPRSTVLV
jgi:hypothetical protein